MGLVCWINAAQPPWPTATLWGLTLSCTGVRAAPIAQPRSQRPRCCGRAVGGTARVGWRNALRGMYGNASQLPGPSPVARTFWSGSTLATTALLLLCPLSAVCPLPSGGAGSGSEIPDPRLEALVAGCLAVLAAEASLFVRPLVSSWERMGKGPRRHDSMRLEARSRLDGWARIRRYTPAGIHVTIELIALVRQRKQRSPFSIYDR